MGEADKERFETIAEACRKILDARGFPETSDSARVLYTEGDLNIAREAGVIEVLFRGSLVFRYASSEATSENVFEEHGLWAGIVERIAASIS